MRKLRLREVKSLTQGHTAGRRQSRDSNLCLGVGSARTQSGPCGQWAEGPGARAKLHAAWDLERHPRGTGTFKGRAPALRSALPMHHDSDLPGSVCLL